MAMIRAASTADVAAVVAVVEEAGLPTGGLADLVAAGHVLVAELGGTVVGCVAVEPAGHQALLRSLAVQPTHRGAGLGRQLVAAAVDRAGDLDLWALTETAEALLARHGFVAVDRATVTGPVSRTGEWAELCPSTAIVMHHLVDPEADAASRRGAR